MYKLLLSIGIVVMFLVGTIIGIQFMIASAEEKAKVKEALVPYVVGCIVIFGAFTIWSIVVNIGQDVAGGSYIVKTKKFEIYNSQDQYIETIYNFEEFSEYFNGSSIKEKYKEYKVHDLYRDKYTYELELIPQKYPDHIADWS